MDSTMKYKKIFTVIFVVVIAVMINVEDNSDDVTFADKKARLPSSKIKTFRFISQLSTLRYVCIFLYINIEVIFHHSHT